MVSNKMKKGIGFIRSVGESECVGNEKLCVEDQERTEADGL